jgi:tetratricopeptide (TPR) repeat protein
MYYRFIAYPLIISFVLTGCATIKQSESGGYIQHQPADIIPLEVTTSIDKDPVYQLMVAEMAVNTGDTETAVSNYLALALSQDDPKIAERAVRIAIYGQDIDAAQRAAERWIELQPDRSEAQQVIAAIYIRQGNDEQAYYYLKRMIDSHSPVDDQIFASLLTLLAREKNTDTVLNVSKKIADNYAGYAYANFLHGSLAASANQSKEALSYLDNALNIKDIPDAHALRAKVLIKLGKREEAVVSLKRAVLSKPNNKQLRLAYARLLVDVKEYENARIEFEKLHQLAPNDPDLLYTLGLLSLESQRFDAAEKYLTRLLQLDKRQNEARYYLGRIFESRGDQGKAVSWYLQVSAGEYNFDAQIRSANLMAQQGKVEMAMAALDKMASSSRSKSALVRIYLAKGEVLKSVDRYHEAIKVYNKGLNVIPGNIDLLYARGLTGEKVDNIELLESDMLTILKTEPDNAHALNALGFTLADRTNRLQEAYQYLKRAIEIKPEDPAIIDSYGWINYRLGNMEEAIRLLRKALSQVKDGEIAAHLGEVLWVNGNHQEAMDLWKTMLEELPEDPFILKVMKQFTQQ